MEMKIGESDIINELMQLFGDLDILSCVRISRFEWIGHVNRMDCKRKVSQVFDNNLQESRPRGRPKNRRRSCVQTVVNKYKLKTGKRGQKTELNGKN
jgi:hypothetical protein